MFPISQIYFFVGGVEESIAKLDGGIGDHGRFASSLDMPLNSIA